MLCYVAHHVVLLPPPPPNKNTKTQSCIVRVPLFLVESVSYLSLSYWMNKAVGCVSPAEKINVVKKQIWLNPLQDSHRTQLSHFAMSRYIGNTLVASLIRAGGVFCDRKASSI